MQYVDGCTSVISSFNINIHRYYYSFCLHPLLTLLPLIDYCNFIIYNTPSSYITKLQILQNSIARCIFNIPKYSHTRYISIPSKLHWLPVRHRILYKTLLLAHKAIHHDSPDYLASLLKLKLPTSTTTRSTNTFLLQLLLNTTYIQPTLAHGQYPSHTPGKLSPHPFVLHHQLPTSRNY